jgi:tetratricopeptide (TPR) repeat protein
MAAAALRLGELYWKKGDLAKGHAAWKKALEQVRAADKIPPDNPELVAQVAAALKPVAETYAQAGLWKESAEQFGAYLKLQREVTDLTCLQAACASCLCDDKAVLRDSCNRALERFPNGGNVLLFSACGLDKLGQIKFAELAKLAEKLVAKDASPWNRFSFALMSYRTGQFDQAIAQGTASSKGSWHLVGINYPVLAMAHHRLGKHTEANRYLLLCKEWGQRSPLQGQVNSLAVIPAAHQPHPHDWMLFDALYREASLLITKSPPFEDIYGQVHRGWLYAKLGESKKAEAELQAAAAVPLKDSSLVVARARVFIQIGQHARAEADFNKAVALSPKKARPWIERARYCAERGRDKQAEADYTRAAAVTDNFNRFIETGWWVVGPYPEELELPCPPENNPHPFKRVAGIVDGIGTAAWKPVAPGDMGQVDLLPVCNNRDHRSAYALTYVYAAKESTATLLVNADDHVRIWLNGSFVYEGHLHGNSSHRLQRVPVTFRAGKNTVLVKVSNQGGAHYMVVRIADNSFDQAKTYSELGLWKEAARHYHNVDLPNDAGAWFRRAYALWQSGDNKGYRDLCRRLLEKCLPEKNSDHLNWTARICVLDAKSVDDWSQPVLAAQKANDLHRSHSGILIALAAAHYRAGQFDAAIQKCQESRHAKARPDSDDRVLTELLQAMAHHRKGQVEEAKKSWLNAENWFVKEAGKLAGLQAVRGPDKMLWENWLIAQVLRKEAATLLKEEVKEKPEVTRLHDHIKAFKPATYDHDLALLLQPNEPRLWLARARRHADLKRNKEAEADFAMAVAINPKVPQAWVDRARFYADLGQVDKAARDFDKALGVRPKDPDWLSRLFLYDLAPREKVLAKLARELRPQDTELQALIHQRQAYLGWVKALAGQKLIPHRTNMVGGAVGGTFEMSLKGPSPLVGFRVWTGRWYNHMVIRGLQPICLSAGGTTDGPAYGLQRDGPSSRIVAKEGYAVGGIVAKGGHVLDGFKIVFMRLDGARLDPNFSYESAWLGGRGGGGEMKVGGDGRPVIGVHGRSGQVVEALGLVQLDVSPPKKDKKP